MTESLTNQDGRTRDTTERAQQTKGTTDTVCSNAADQLSLFPNHRLHSVHSQRVASKRRPIRLAHSILVILPTEQLHQYLSRVAAAAMTAATKSYGSSALAALRLGTADSEDPEPTGPLQTARPKLALAEAVRQNKSFRRA